MRTHLGSPGRGGERARRTQTRAVSRRIECVARFGLGAHVPKLDPGGLRLVAAFFTLLAINQGWQLAKSVYDLVTRERDEYEFDM